ncbi:hypothetical protein K435DRAFT_844605 [Dendrothele bispora CBS 962.96]|uniref:Uncharacterized protein n=1 Tax=Dendrothele bispora (strain CBS 962.96) TaxID=1314807 RepID=A0A4S8L0B6_DENBC|nr:hypothetical protein K435DRAFT_844605 [Dendrothele bispora CBS 962.96]
MSFQGHTYRPTSLIGAQPGSPLRLSFANSTVLDLNGHSRILTPYSPPLQSPLSFSFSAEVKSGGGPNHPIPSSTSAPETSLDIFDYTLVTPSTSLSGRPQNTIAADASQEIEVKNLNLRTSEPNQHLSPSLHGSPNLVLPSLAPSVSESSYLNSQTHVPGPGITEQMPGALQIRSLSCAAVGYWVVFDAFGAGSDWGTEVKSKRKKLRRAYG